jgi:hypothetical protein
MVGAVMVGGAISTDASAQIAIKPMVGSFLIRAEHALAGGGRLFLDSI